MSIRKVQKTGGSSFVVTLPKTWIDKLNIQEKDSLMIIPQPNGTLLVSADVNRDHVKRKQTLQIMENTDEDYLFRMLIGSYIMGFDIIQIKSSVKFSSEIKKAIRNFIQNVIGFEIFDETLSSIILKDLLNPIEMPFGVSVKRMNISIQGMHEDIITALEKKDLNLAKDVIIRDHEINRRYRLIARQSNMILHDVVLAQRMNITLDDAHHYFLISKQLERVGDHAKAMANQVVELLKQDLEGNVIQNIIDVIKNANSMSSKALGDSVQAWEQRDLKLANEIIEIVPQIKKACGEIIEYRDGPPKIYIHLGAISEDIDRTGEYAANIAEIVFDNILKSPLNSNNS